MTATEYMTSKTSAYYFAIYLLFFSVVALLQNDRAIVSPHLFATEPKSPVRQTEVTPKSFVPTFGVTYMNQQENVAKTEVFIYI